MTVTPQQIISPATEVETSKRILSVLDRVGACASTACALHCVLLPFVITALPFLGLSVFASSAFEMGMIVFTVALATFSFCWGGKLHGEWRTLLLVLAALTLFAFGHELDGTLHRVVMALGGVSLATGHILNRRLCKSCKQCEH